MAPVAIRALKAATASVSAPSSKIGFAAKAPPACPKAPIVAQKIPAEREP